jgi:biotin transport system substrate-specific component
LLTFLQFLGSFLDSNPFYGAFMTSIARPITGTPSSVLSQLLWTTGFAVATALAARLEIPNYPVPFTLQTMAVLLAGAFLGARNGALSQMLYLGFGLAGLPVFAGGAFGIMKLIGPTGGYLLAFPIAAALVGRLLNDRRSLGIVLLSMAAGLLVIFTIGTAHLYAFTLHNASAAFTAGFLIFSWWDVLKLGAASMIYFELAKKWPRLG